MYAKVHTKMDKKYLQRCIEDCMQVVIELGHAVRQTYNSGFLIALPPVQGTS